MTRTTWTIAGGIALGVLICGAVWMYSNLPEPRVDVARVHPDPAPSAQDRVRKPPRFQVVAATEPGPQQVGDPYAAGYDPAALLRERRASLAEIFSREPRDPIWAWVREKQIRSLVEAGVATAQGVLRLVECRSFVCRLVGDLPPRARAGPWMVSLGNATADSSPAPSPDALQMVRHERFIFFKAGLRDPEAYQEFANQVRETMKAAGL